MNVIFKFLIENSEFHSVLHERTVIKNQISYSDLNFWDRYRAHVQAAETDRRDVQNHCFRLPDAMKTMKIRRQTEVEILDAYQTYPIHRPLGRIVQWATICKQLAHTELM